MHILAFAAHPDDVEEMCFGTLMKYRAQGDKIYVALSTSGNIGSNWHESKESIAAVREQERIKYEEDRRNAIDNYHSELKISGEEHYYATNDECNAQKKRLDDEFSKNGGRWADEIFSNIVSAV